MVNRGASRGCITCRQRRVKCDERKPWCKACLRLGRACAGYGSTRLRFKDETSRYLEKSPSRAIRVRECNLTLSRNKYDYAIRPSLQPHPQDLAVSFFLTYVTSIGRSLESTRGFLEFVRPVLITERPDSALFTAVNAAAIKVWTILGHGHFPSSMSRQLLGRALVRLQKAVQDPEERECDATVLAALVLQAHDTMSAAFCQDRAQGVHRDGALALLLQRGSGMKKSTCRANLLGNLLHAKVSLCVREGLSLPLSELEWFQSQVIPIVPVNPSSLLDIIGISVANLQHSFRDTIQPNQDRLPCGLEKLVEQVGAVRVQLQTWLEAVPQHWYPKRMKSGQDIDSSIDTYRGACDVYPSIQITNVWNSWRIYHLILELIKLRLINYITLSRFQELATNSSKYVDDTINWARNTCGAQELVDSICYSIPFYLGNCTHPAMISNIDDPQVIFPSYHDLHPSDEAFLRYKVSDHHVSKVDHCRHVLLHGPLHTTSILSHFIRLLAQVRSSVDGQILQQEQQQWIAEQFLRSLYLMRLVPDRFSYDANDPDPKVQFRQQSAVFSQAETMAKAVKRGLWTLNIV